jgi:hypothetical protein
MPRKENRVVVHYRDGALVKGTTLDFFPTKDTFHVTDHSSLIHEVALDDLKAVFFVKSFDGDAEHAERRGFFTGHTQGKKVMVEFEDGETLFGYTLSYTARGLGFFVFPGDPESNNLKIFVVLGATNRIKVRTLSPTYTTHPHSR